MVYSTRTTTRPSTILSLFIAWLVSCASAQFDATIPADEHSHDNYTDSGNNGNGHANANSEAATTSSSSSTDGTSARIIAISVAFGVVSAGLIILIFIKWRRDRNLTRNIFPSHGQTMVQSSVGGVTVNGANPGTGSGSAGGTTATRTRRPRRTPSVATVPEYTLEANEDEIVLDKAEFGIVETIEMVESSAASSASHDTSTNPPSPDSVRPPRRPHLGSARHSFDPALRLRDIERPAPELTVDRYDSVALEDGSSVDRNANALLSFQAHRHRMSAISSTMSISSTLEDSPLVGDDGSPLAPPSFYDTPAYFNRSRSRSIETGVYPNPTGYLEGGVQGHSTLTSTSNLHSSSTASSPGEVGHDMSARASSGFINFFKRRHSQSASSLLPLHTRSTVPSVANNGTNTATGTTTASASTTTTTTERARRDALRIRDISAPLSDTLVRSSYVFPRAGINPLQAAWLGSRDTIARMTTYLDTAPPAFQEEAAAEQQASADANLTIAMTPSRADQHQSTAAVSSSMDVPAAATQSDSPATHGHSTTTAAVEAPQDQHSRHPRNAFSQLEEESAQLSSLVHRASIARAGSQASARTRVPLSRNGSLVPHLVALPPSLPSSPVSPNNTNAEWPLIRKSSTASAGAATAVSERSDGLLRMAVRHGSTSSNLSALSPSSTMALGLQNIAEGFPLPPCNIANAETVESPTSATQA